MRVNIAFHWLLSSFLPREAPKIHQHTGFNLPLTVLTEWPLHSLGSSSCCTPRAGADLTVAIYVSRYFINILYCSKAIFRPVNRRDEQKLTLVSKMEPAKGNCILYIFILTRYFCYLISLLPNSRLGIFLSKNFSLGSVLVALGKSL